MKINDAVLLKLYTMLIKLVLTIEQRLNYPAIPKYKEFPELKQGEVPF